jgi:hypothetical protein
VGTVWEKSNFEFLHLYLWGQNNFRKKECSCKSLQFTIKDIIHTKKKKEKKKKREKENKGEGLNNINN